MTIAAGLILALTMGCGMMEKAAAEQTKLIIFSPEGSTEVSIDGGDPTTLEEARFIAPAVGPGTHVVKLGNGREIEVVLEAFDEKVVPVIDNQCFMSIDVTFSHYGTGDAPPPGGPSITQRKQESAPFRFPSNNWLRESDLPERIEVGRPALLLRSISCAEMDRLEAGLAKAKP